MGLWAMGKRTGLAVEYVERDDFLDRIVDKIFTDCRALLCFLWPLPRKSFH